jgi:hypothetical protein
MSFHLGPFDVEIDGDELEIEIGDLEIEFDEDGLEIELD